MRRQMVHLEADSFLQRKSLSHHHHRNRTIVIVIITIIGILPNNTSNKNKNNAINTDRNGYDEREIEREDELPEPVEADFDAA